MTPEELFALFAAAPQPRPVFYRLYHDDAGRPLFYTMEDLAGLYIEVDAKAYALASHDVRVVDGRLIFHKKKVAVRKLQPNDQGVCCNPNDVCIIVDESQPHVKWKMREQD